MQLKRIKRKSDVDYKCWTLHTRHNTKHNTLTHIYNTTHPCYTTHTLTHSLYQILYRKEKMRELERKSMIQSNKSEEDLIRQGREEAARDLASLKVRTDGLTCLVVMDFFQLMGGGGEEREGRK
jgi:hypothetical protein